MQPVIVMPMNDPAGLVFPHVQAVTPDLKRIFERAFVSVTAVTRARYPENSAWLEKDDFFQVLQHPGDVTVGEDFHRLYASAAAACPPGQILHLCFPDRVTFALQSEYREAFIADMQSLRAQDTPLIFERSAAAWATHPHNYFVIEHMVTQVGAFLFKKEYDFGWPHLALQAGQLEKILPHIRNRDLSMVAELVLLLKDEIGAKDVDWLAWEDPFIFGRDPQELKAEKEASNEEVRKRLAYVIPMLQLLEAAARRES